MKVIIALIYLFIIVALTSCESIGICKICRQVTYVDGAVTNEGPEAEYCDARLIAIEATPDYIDGNLRVSWECR